KLGHELILELRAAGHAVDAVTSGESFSRLSESSFTVRPESRDDHAALLRELIGAGRPPAQIVHLGATGPEDDTDVTADAATNKYLFPLVALAQALVDEETAGRTELVVVTNGAES